MAKPVIPLGEPADWSRDDVARLSRVSDGDKVEAREYWRQNAPRVLPESGNPAPVNAKDLIDATPRRNRGGV